MVPDIWVTGLLGLGLDNGEVAAVWVCLLARCRYVPEASGSKAAWAFQRNHDATEVVKGHADKTANLFFFFFFLIPFFALINIVAFLFYELAP